MSQPNSNPAPVPRSDATREIAPAAMEATHWFLEHAKQSFEDNLLNVTIYGPAVTTIFDAREHQIHFLLVLASRSVEQLLDLAKYSKQATRKRVSPPLVMTDDAVKRSRDVFPLEWLDIAQFHRTLFGNPIGDELSLDAKFIRLQCERELRSLDMHLQQGILASGGKESRVRRLEDDSADSLVRVLRGIGWLSGDREGLLPTELIARCEKITQIELTGCSEAIKLGGRHDLPIVKSLLLEVAQLSNWIDAKNVETE